MSTARRLLIDLAAAAAVRCQRVNAFLASLNSLVDKRHRREWQVVNDARRAEAHLQGLLRDIGLERRVKPVPDLGDYLKVKAGEAGHEPPVDEETIFKNSKITPGDGEATPVEQSKLVEAPNETPVEEETRTT